MLNTQVLQSLQQYLVIDNVGQRENLPTADDAVTTITIASSNNPPVITIKLPDLKLALQQFLTTILVTIAI